MFWCGVWGRAKWVAFEVVVVQALLASHVLHQSEPLCVARVQVACVVQPDLLWELGIWELDERGFWCPIAPELCTGVSDELRSSAHRWQLMPQAALLLADNGCG